MIRGPCESPLLDLCVWCRAAAADASARRLCDSVHAEAGGGGAGRGQGASTRVLRQPDDYARRADESRRRRCQFLKAEKKPYPENFIAKYKLIIAKKMKEPFNRVPVRINASESGQSPAGC